MIRTPKASLCAALATAADGQIALARDLAWLHLLLAARSEHATNAHGLARDATVNAAASNQHHANEMAANDRSWLRDCVTVGLAGIVLGLIVGGVWL